MLWCPDPEGPEGTAQGRLQTATASATCGFGAVQLTRRESHFTAHHGMVCITICTVVAMCCYDIVQSRASGDDEV